MASSPSVLRRAAVVGGGIAGLVAAHRLVELDPALDVVLYESERRLGGSLFTIRQDGFLIEQGADSFITNVPWGLDLCRKIGFVDQLIPTNPQHRHVSLVHRGRLRPVPDGFMLMAPKRLWPMVTTPVLSVRGKLRLAWEYFVPRRTESGDESLASFVRRRLGQEALERLVQPLVAGIYTADPERLSLMATFPRFQQMEREHGSLIRATRRQRRAAAATNDSLSGSRYELFVTPRDGLSSLVAALAARLPRSAVRYGTRVDRLVRQGNRWRLRLSGNNSLGAVEDGLLEAELFDVVVIATPASVAARLLAEVDGELTAELARIEYASTAVVSVGYDTEQMRQPPDGFGFVVPAVERRRILSASYSSAKFPGRAPLGQMLIRVFVGGACQPEMAQLSDDDLLRVVTEELAELLGTRGSPRTVTIARWLGAMPQYHVGHMERVARIDARIDALGGLALAGNAYHGVGIPYTIHSGEAAVERLLAGN
jgi:oxygen-dependent protoporphyrinogen oxidase